MKFLSCEKCTRNLRNIVKLVVPKKWCASCQSSHKVLRLLSIDRKFILVRYLAFSKTHPKFEKYCGTSTDKNIVRLVSVLYLPFFFFFLNSHSTTQMQHFRRAYLEENDISPSLHPAKNLLSFVIALSQKFTRNLKDTVEHLLPKILRATYRCFALYCFNFYFFLNPR